MRTVTIEVNTKALIVATGLVVVGILIYKATEKEEEKLAVLGEYNKFPLWQQPWG